MKSFISSTLSSHALVMVGLCFSSIGLQAQTNKVTSLALNSKASYIANNTYSTEKPAEMKLDTVECLFHQLINNSRPLLTWRRGYIVLENDKLRVADQLYDKSQASSVTGLIQNQFLAGNKRKPVTKKVVQVVLLQ